MRGLAFAVVVLVGCSGTAATIDGDADAGGDPDNRIETPLDASQSASSDGAPAGSDGGPGSVPDGAQGRDAAITPEAGDPPPDSAPPDAGSPFTGYVDAGPYESIAGQICGRPEAFTLWAIPDTACLYATGGYIVPAINGSEAACSGGKSAGDVCFALCPGQGQAILIYMSDEGMRRVCSGGTCPNSCP